MDTLHSMRVFVRVIDTGSFTAAALALDLSTAQVSRLVSDLEQQLEARLLNRTTRRLALTEVGERYLQRCRQILAEVEEASAEARGAHLKPSGRLRVHTMTGLGLQHLTTLVARYSELYPEVVIELTLSQRTPDLLEDGQDVIITFARELPDSQMVAQVLGPMYSVICAAPSYLAKHGVPQDPADLQQHRYLRLLDPLYHDNWVLNGDDGEFDVLPAESLQVNVAESLAKAAQAGMGFCLLPSFVACPFLREGSLLRVLPEYRLRARNIYAIYPSRRFLDAKIKTWVDFLKAELPPLLALDEAILDDSTHWATC
ncbi:LysR family transcriptional regulator [Metapseudomonas boanensis]|uniref:LysR family transcriptional regulator n=1 Tax=Metapseudomonas boanensis TaxID=2822138 RepID=A0ABS5XQD8_9GAMM|nr:LysR family transcriptional regulator [Pseudomonas boanensis]MBT8769326.1 LysR family transcriptional regulator [Pseudomonas boanensis]